MKQIILDRRALHRIPELDRNLDRTMKYLKDSLSVLRCEVFSPIPDALCAYFDFGAGKSIAFRSGADALPVHEATSLPFASEYPGRMHACGHDAHMSILLELARRLNGARGRYNVLLLFQPAEETTGSARDICKSGVFEKYRTEAIFGLHLWPDLKLGSIMSRRGNMMSRSCEVNLRCFGRACNVSFADKGTDALDAAVRFLAEAKKMEESYPEEVHRLLHFGHLESGSACNVVSDRSILEGTLRAFEDEVFFGMLNKLENIVKQIEAENGCRMMLETSMGYPPVINPEALVERVKKSGIEFGELESPVMLTEDFSWYQKHLPGMFFFLGCGPCPPLQTDAFSFDESILETGADFLESIAFCFR